MVFVFTRIGRGGEVLPANSVHRSEGITLTQPLGLTAVDAQAGDNILQGAPHSVQVDLYVEEPVAVCIGCHAEDDLVGGCFHDGGLEVTECEVKTESPPLLTSPLTRLTLTNFSLIAG